MDFSPGTASEVFTLRFNRKHSRPVSLSLLLVSLLIGQPVLAAPIATNTALPLSKHEFIFREQFSFLHARDDLSGSKREITRFESRSVLGYGLTPKWAIFGVLPIAQVKREFGINRTKQSGLGDTSLFTRYEIYQADKPGRTFRIAPYFGVRAPTGRDGKTGDGSTDFFSGLISTLATTQWVLDSQIRFDLNRKADSFKRGNVTRLESSFQYRLSPKQVTINVKGFIFGVLELGAFHYERNQIMGLTDPNSGGFQLFLTPGVQYATQRWIVDLGVKIPVVSRLNGNALEPDYEILTSLRINF